ncbi:MAG TPA: amidohydrolase family protein, partial [Ferruginibacter sp.]|nr:amidohydrolase family protein [Ferruginibacter sp.]
HIVHVSSAEALPMISDAKAAGLPLTAETCAHYIYFNADMIPDAQPLFKCAPPIREKENNEQLKKALQSGILDFLTTDHSPAPPAIKALDTGSLQQAWGGIAGLQFLLSAGWSALKENLSLEEYIPLVTSKPAYFLGLQSSKGVIEIGADADFVVWQPEVNEMVEPSQIQHRFSCSAYAHQKLYGKILKTIINGITVCEHNNIINLNAGTWLLKK